MDSKMTLKLYLGILCSVASVVAVSACDTLDLGAGGTAGATPQGGSECQNKCSTDWDAAMNACAKISDDADRKACQDSADAVLSHCQGACRGDPVEECKKKCDQENIDCIASCPKGDKACMSKCNEVYSKCLKNCGK